MAQASMTRAQATRRVVSTLHQLAPERELEYRNDAGESPLVIAFPSDHVSEVLARVARVGGGANVAVCFAKNFQTVVLVNGSGVEPDEWINRDLSMGMFLIKVQASPTKRLGFRFKGVEADATNAQREMQYA